MGLGIIEGETRVIVSGMTMEEVWLLVVPLATVA
jgi:hypothetical protein